MAFNKEDSEYNLLKKKIKQIDSKIHKLDKDKLVEKKYSHSHSHTDEINNEIKQLLREKRTYLKRIKKIERKK
jgi:hypothetical protein